MDGMPMSVTIGTDSYADEAELTAYAAARGETIRGDSSALLIKAMDYIELQNYAGEKTDPAQPLEFPRDGLTTVPAGIKKAQLVAAMLTDTGSDLLAPIGPRVTNETVGPLSVSYSDTGNQSTIYSQLSALLKPFLSTSGGMFNFEVVRA